MRATDRTIIEGQIAGAYLALAPSGPVPGFAGLRELREALADIAREDLDEVLTGLYGQQVINLIPRSDQQALTPADREAAVHVGGEDKHLLGWD